MQPPILTTKDLSVGYLQGKSRKVVLSDLNLQLRQGEVVSLLGSNGAGKSTLLRTISGVQFPLSGEVTLKGKPIGAHTPRQMARMMGIVYTDRTLAGGLTVHELVSLGRQPYTGFFGRLDANDLEIVSNAISIVGIEKKSHTPLAMLSDGERQKAIIAKALAQQTPIIIMDEPTAFLDAASRLEIMTLLHSLAHVEGKTILLSTHDIGPALEMSDHVWMIRPDSKLFTGSPEHLAMSEYGLRQLFSDRNVEFDPLTGDFRGKINESGTVTLNCGDPVTTRWMTNLLRRIGFNVGNNPRVIITALSFDNISINGKPVIITDEWGNTANSLRHHIIKALST